MLYPVGCCRDGRAYLGIKLCRCFVILARYGRSLHIQVHTCVDIMKGGLPRRFDNKLLLATAFPPKHAANCTLEFDPSDFDIDRSYLGSRMRCGMVEYHSGGVALFSSRAGVQLGNIFFKQKCSLLGVESRQSCITIATYPTGQRIDTLK
jgi:hypothetical protein